MAELVGKMALNRWTTGLVFSLSGFSRKAIAVAERASGSDLRIALVGPEEITGLIESEDRAESIRQAVERPRLSG